MLADVDPYANLEPVPASMIWCVVCAKPARYRVIPLEPISKRHRPGFVGDHMKCNGCGSLLATIYAEEISA